MKYEGRMYSIAARGNFRKISLGCWLAIATHDGAYQDLIGAWWILPAMLI